MIFTNGKEAQLAQALIEKKRPGRSVRVIKAAPASKEHYITYDNIDLPLTISLKC